MATTIKKVVDYVLRTPHNTNEAILTEMLEELQGEGSMPSLNDGVFVIDSNGNLTLRGFEEALPGQVPVKRENGMIEWIDLETVGEKINIEDLGQEEPVIFYGGSASEII